MYPIKIATTLLVSSHNYYKMISVQYMSIQLNPTLANEKENT